MAELDRLFTEFVERHLAGEDPDPWSYIDQLSGDRARGARGADRRLLRRRPAAKLERRRIQGLERRANRRRPGSLLSRPGGAVAGGPAAASRPSAADARRAGRAPGGEARGGRPPREGGRLLPRDGAGPPALRGGVGPGPRRPGWDRRNERRGPAEGRRAALGRAIGRGRGSGLRADGEARRRSTRQARRWRPTMRTAPSSGTRWTSCSGAAEQCPWSPPVPAHEPVAPARPLIRTARPARETTVGLHRAVRGRRRRAPVLILARREELRASLM